MAKPVPRPAMRGARSWWTLAMLAAALLAVAGVGVAEEVDVSIEIDADGNVTSEDPNGTIVDERHDPPASYAWELALQQDYQLVNVTVDEGFPVDRPRQLVPTFDERHFVEVDDPAKVDRAAQVFNLTQGQTTWSYQLGLPGPGDGNLTLERDLQAPDIEVVSVGNVSEIGFDVTTNTSEVARAELFVRGPGGDVIQNYPTGPGAWQRFPVQGLEANTTYEFYVEAADWSGNQVESEAVEVTTKESPEPPKPIVEPVRPEPNSTVSPEGVVVEASFSEEGWPIVKRDIRLFFDKERIDDAEIEVTDGSVVYRADGPLQPRTYFVSVEVPNTADGVGVARWSFQVAEDPVRSSPGPLGLIPAVLGACLLAVRPRS